MKFIILIVTLFTIGQVFGSEEPKLMAQCTGAEYRFDLFERDYLRCDSARNICSYFYTKAKLYKNDELILKMDCGQVSMNGLEIWECRDPRPRRNNLEITVYGDFVMNRIFGKIIEGFSTTIHLSCEGK